MNAMSKEAPERQDIEALLPWHAAGTLNRRDAQRVEQALAADRELRQQYELVREELAETIRLNESLGAPSARAMEKLFSAINAEPARKPVSLGLGARLSEFVASFSPRTLAYAGIAGAIAIVLQAGIITGVLVQDRGADYQTVSAPSATATVPHAVVQFAPQAAAGDITRFLEANRLTVVEGPVGGGIYKVRVVGAEPSKDDVGRLVQRLQGDRVLTFVAPAQPQ
jgi:hypothetical protein